ncbi:MAG: hypothetical protein ACKO0W_09250 [Planctomycetota bacterium]
MLKTLLKDMIDTVRSVLPRRRGAFGQAMQHQVPSGASPLRDRCSWEVVEPQGNSRPCIRGLRFSRRAAYRSTAILSEERLRAYIEEIESRPVTIDELRSAVVRHEELCDRMEPLLSAFGERVLRAWSRARARCRSARRLRRAMRREDVNDAPIRAAAREAGVDERIFVRAALGELAAVELLSSRILRRIFGDRDDDGLGISAPLPPSGPLDDLYAAALLREGAELRYLMLQRMESVPSVRPLRWLDRETSGRMSPISVADMLRILKDEHESGGGGGWPPVGGEIPSDRFARVQCRNGSDDIGAFPRRSDPPAARSA